MAKSNMLKVTINFKVRLIAGLLLIAVLAGCQSQAIKSSADSRTAVKQPLAEKTPLKSDLSAELVYSVLAGEIAGQRGDLPLAYDEYMQAARLSRSPQAAEKASRIAAFLENDQQVLEAARLWLELSPDDLAAMQIIGAVLVHQDQLAQALPYLKSVITGMNKQGADGFLQIANLLSKDENKTRALSAMQQLAADYPDQAKAHYAVALLAVHAEKSELAFSELDHALRLKPGWSKPVALKSSIYQQNKQPEKALAVLKTALQDYPENKILRTSYARL
ncbi:MAG: tetratricopeptide repeat protein, partial [gamma proteobacterium symbiont of Bathyaustriella thionipta]|nr:tetratricopeptide repeat protein [gamma proteobacterium symbiont of Bathyaustriella thionipta]